jgi:hypothetical protein
MRIFFVISTVVVGVALFGCAHDHAEKLSWNYHSILARGESIATLNAKANEKVNDQAECARSVFTLFAYHIRPGSSAAEVHRVLTNASWLQDTHLYGVRALGGWSAVPLTSDGTVFTMHLFPMEKDKRWSPWGISFRLSGTLRDEDALAFLRGEKVAGNPKIEEFSLCYPERRNPDGSIPDIRKMPRIERFSPRGIHVYFED